MLYLIDIGANLTHESFSSDLPAVLERASEHRVGTLIITGASVAASRQALQLAEQYPQCYATAGIHPHEAQSFDEHALENLRRYAQHAKLVSLGECGLDFNRNYAPQEAQLACFEAQLQLAAELGKPLFLHERDAHRDFVKMLGRYRDQLLQVVVHCFTGNEYELRAYLEMDCHIGITGWLCDERRGQHLHALLPLIPANRLMLETDSPYLLPRDLQPKPKSRRNEPMHLLHIARTVARLYGKPLETLIAETQQTSQAFFKLPQ